MLYGLQSLVGLHYFQTRSSATLDTLQFLNQFVCWFKVKKNTKDSQFQPWPFTAMLVRINCGFLNAVKPS